MNCVICTLDIVNYNSEILKCSHRFHPYCINIWKTRSNTCPLCRADLSEEFDYDNSLEISHCEYLKIRKEIDKKIETK